VGAGSTPTHYSFFLCCSKPWSTPDQFECIGQGRSDWCAKAELSTR
jgi:hypothetical protein